MKNVQNALPADLRRRLLSVLVTALRSFTVYAAHNVLVHRRSAYKQPKNRDVSTDCLLPRLVASSKNPAVRWQAQLRSVLLRRGVSTNHQQSSDRSNRTRPTIRRSPHAHRHEAKPAGCQKGRLPAMAIDPPSPNNRHSK